MDEAKDLALAVHNDVSSAKNLSEKAKSTLEDAETEIKKFLEMLADTPDEIKKLANDVWIAFQAGVESFLKNS